MSHGYGLQKRHAIWYFFVAAQTGQSRNGRLSKIILLFRCYLAHRREGVELPVCAMVKTGVAKQVCFMSGRLLALQIATQVERQESANVATDFQK